MIIFPCYELVAQFKTGKLLLTDHFLSVFFYQTVDFASSKLSSALQPSMISTRKRNQQNKRRISQLDEPLNNFVVRSNFRVGEDPNETVEFHHTDFVSITNVQQLVKVIHIMFSSLKEMWPT